MTNTDTIMPSLHFKRLPEGWLFRSPSLWIFNKPEHYIVTDAQKVEIDHVLPRSKTHSVRKVWLWSIAFVAVLAGLIAAVTLAAPTYPFTATTTLIAVTLAGSFYYLHRLSKLQLQRLKPILAGAARTDQTISLAEMQRGLNSSVGAPRARRSAIVSGLAAVGMLIAVSAMAFMRHRSGTPITDTTIAMFILYALMMGMTSASQFQQALLNEQTTGDNAPPESAARAQLLGRLTLAFAAVGALLLVGMVAVGISGEFSNVAQGQRYEANGRHDDAIASFTRALDSDPGNATALRARGEIHAARKDWDRAIADFTRLIAIEPRNPRFYRERARAYRAGNNFAAAISDYDKAIALEPAHAFSYLFRGHSFADMKNYPPAISDFTKAIGLDLTDPYAYIARGRAFESTGDRARAMSDADAAIALNPKLDGAHYFRAGLHATAKNRERALADYSSAIEVNPKTVFSYISRGFIFVADNDYDRAIADFTKAATNDPANFLAYEARASVYALKGDKALAIADYKTILGLPADAAANRARQQEARSRLDKLMAQP